MASVKVNSSLGRCSAVAGRDVPQGGIPRGTYTVALLNPSQFASFAVCGLPRLSQKIVIAPRCALHDELRLLTGLVVDGVVDGSELRARLGDDYLIVTYFDA